MALVEVHGSWRVQEPIPQISGPNLQENHIIETRKEEGCAIPQENRFADSMGGWGICHVYQLFEPIAVPIRESPTYLREAINNTLILEKYSS
jgi:hypothetical protein